MTGDVRKIPGTVTKVNQTTGEKTHEGTSWTLLPPAAGKCQFCAAQHEPGEPHNAQSLYYQATFHGMIGRAPTWADAMAHCDQATRVAWETELRRRRAWSEPPDGEAPVRHHGVD